MKLINPINLGAALIASAMCLAYGSRPVYSRENVYFVAGNGARAGYHSGTGGSMVEGKCGCMIAHFPRKVSRIAGLKRFLANVKIAHKGSINCD